MKVKRFDFNFKPLQIDISLSVVGSVPDRQNYDADADEYTPDYTLTPLVIQPQISRMDKDEILTPGSVNSNLANVRWYEIVGGTRTQILADNTDYEITTSGGNAGRILVKKNAQPQNPITLEYYAEYMDQRTGQIHVLQKTFPIRCSNSTVFKPVLILDTPDQTIYNPLKDQAVQVIHASLRCGENECAAANRIFVWEKFRENNTWTQIGTDTVLDYDVQVSNDTASLTIDRSLMGADLYIRCRAKYDRGGNPASVALTDASPECITSFVRRIPKFEFDIAGVPTNIPAGILKIAPEAKIWDVNGTIANPERELLILWYAATNRASGSLTYNQVGHGQTPLLPTKDMSDLLGAVFGLDVQDAGPTCCWEDGDGSLFEDEDGYLLLIK